MDERDIIEFDPNDEEEEEEDDDPNVIKIRVNDGINTKDKYGG